MADFGLTFTPFDPLPASDLNTLVSNDNALRDGTGIADDAITAAKMLNGLVMQRKGGSATSWATDGNTVYNVSNLDVKIQVGAHQASNGVNTITFPVAFTQPPVVTFSITSYGTGSINQYIVGTTATFFDAYIAGLPAVQPLTWVAIGI